MPRLHQFHFHIRSVLKKTSRVTIEQIHPSFVKRQQTFHCVFDHFKNNYGQCQISSLPFLAPRLDFLSNRFPLFNDQTVSNVTNFLLFDDVEPFQSVFFPRVAKALPRLRTFQIINQLEQREQTIATHTNIHFHHLAGLILDEIHLDYAEQFLSQIYLPSLIELLIDKEI